MTAGSPAPCDVVVVGNIGIDTNVYLPGGNLDLEAESRFTDNIACIGQAGGYSSRGYARLGQSVAFIGFVGDDHDGRHIRETLRHDGVDCSALAVDPAGTSRSVNLMLAGGGRKTFYDGKSHLLLHPDLALCTAILSPSKLVHMHLPHWARELLPVARRLGLTIACDLQDIRDPEDAYRRDFLEASDIVFFSAVNQREPLALVRSLTTRFPGKIFVVGRGEQGCALARQGVVQTFPPVFSSRPVVDTNGAGDALAVGFLTSLVLERRPVEESVLRGQIAARHVCSLRGSSSDLISMAELNDRCSTMMDATA